MKRACGLACAALALLGSPMVRAEAGWFEAGDVTLRNDLQLLNDAEIIRFPVNQWPVPRAAVRYAVENGRREFATNRAVQAALARVQARLEPGKRGASFSYGVTAGEDGLLRDFDRVAREGGDLHARATFRAGDRAEVSLQAGAAIDPDDDEELRLDGSHATVRLGNWLLSAQALERWWGAGHESSLILSNNARPIPTLVVERATARPFSSPWLSWLGPWRFSFGVGRMESDRADIDAPLFMAWHVSVMPFRDVELGFSRTAQFCGEQLTCDADSFFNMLAGNDNVGFDATPETEPGNQMAGFDLRWASPIGSWPYAITFQAIGEDESSYLPAKYLVQFGLEAWKPLANGGLVQVFTEYADTTCSAISSSGPYYNCAYNQGRFDVDGYRFHGRSVGHTTDRDSRSAAIGGSLTTERGALWTATLRAAELNRDGTPDPTAALTPVPLDYAALELGWRGRLAGGSVSVEVGLESLRLPGADRDVEPYGYLGWRHELP